MVAAARAILAEEGEEAVTVQAVVKRARASVGSFYARFPGRDELVAYVQQTVWSDVLEGWDARLASTDWAALDLEGTVSALVRHLVELRSPAHADPSALAALRRDDRRAELRARVLASAAELLNPHRDQVRHADPALAISVAFLAVEGALASLGAAVDPFAAEAEPASDGEDDHGDPTSRAVEELTGLVMAYFGLGGAGATEGRRVDYFDVWG